MSDSIPLQSKVKLIKIHHSHNPVLKSFLGESGIVRYRDDKGFLSVDFGLGFQFWIKPCYLEKLDEN